MQELKASNQALGHLRANLWLLVLSVVICCVLYPGAVWVVGWLFFHNAAEGSLVDKDGKPTTDSSKAVGSSQIAQPFSSAWLFQPRPSAASYNGAASSGSNYAASNPKLRGRVASQLGTISRYTQAHQDAWAAAYQKAHPGEKAPSPPSPQDDVTAWFKAQAEAKRDLFTDWANNNSTLAGAWATGTAPIQDYILQWAKDHPDVVAAWKKDNKDSPKTLDAADPTKQLGAGDLVGYFFSSFEKEHFAKWPTSEAISAWAKDHPAILTRWKAANADKGDPTDDDLTTFFPDDSAKNPGDWPAAKADEWVDVAQKAVVKPDAPQDSDIEQTFFDTWYTEQFKAGSLKPEDFRQVPADMVTASGSGLDPDITLANALYQEDELVIPAYAEKIVADFLARDENKNLTDEQKHQKHEELVEKWTPEIKKHVDKALEGLPSRPMFGLTGDEPLVNVLQLNLRWQAEMANIKTP